ncbi:hypothetical protein PHYSODRAFT_419271, partial [Phytophthora sojae]
AFEDTVSRLYSFLLVPITELTGNSWVLDTGCGYGLTASESVFVTKQPNSDYVFTFGQGSKLRNTFVGTVKLFLMSPTGVKSVQFSDIALVPHAKSNILSEFWLKRAGYQIVASNSGLYKFILWKHKLIFVAKSFNGAYYVQACTTKERQRMCNAVQL